MQRDTIKLCRLVDATIVNAHAPGSVFCFKHNKWRRLWRYRRACDVRVRQLFDFTFDGDALVSVGNATRKLAKNAKVAVVDLIKYNVSSAYVGIAFSEDVELFFY